MAFPADYEENIGRCMGKYQDHTWSTSGHPLSHRCTTCHRPKWTEVKKELKVPIGYIAPVVWGGHDVS